MSGFGEEVRAGDTPSWLKPPSWTIWLAGTPNLYTEGWTSLSFTLEFTTKLCAKEKMIQLQGVTVDQKVFKLQQEPEDYQYSQT